MRPRRRESEVLAACAERGVEGSFERVSAVERRGERPRLGVAHGRGRDGGRVSPRVEIHSEETVGLTAPSAPRFPLSLVPIADASIAVGASDAPASLGSPPTVEPVEVPVGLEVQPVARIPIAARRAEGKRIASWNHGPGG